MNEKLDFQDMKSIHEIRVTRRRDIPWLGTSKRPSIMKLASLSIFPEEKSKGSHKEIDVIAGGYFLFSLTAMFPSKMCLVVPRHILVVPP